MIETLEKPKNKGGRPRKIKPVEGNVGNAIVALPGSQAPESVYGWKVKEGFYRMMLFSSPSEGSKPAPVTIQAGEHKPVTLYKNKMHVVPGAIMHAICDTVNEYPEDDTTSDPQHPVRTWVKRTEVPHSDPIEATWQEFKAYKDNESTKPTAAEYLKQKR